ncbi:MAG: alpha/beta hydrolase domain-containing protein [Pirellulaceae bacterium]
MNRHLLTILLLILAGESFAQAEVTRLEIQKREAYAAGKVHGDRGSYEKLTGVVHFALDPEVAANQIVRDLALAERNKDSKVEFWADFEILVPKDLGKANGALLYEVNNRGNKTAPGIFDGGADDFLLRQGFIVVWSGWIAEVLPADGKFKMWAPMAKENGRPVQGIVRQEVVVDKLSPKANLAHRGGQGSYRPTANGLATATLTVREHEADPRKTVPRENWKLGVTEISYQDRPWPLPVVELEVKGGLKPGWIYEVVYEGEGSVVQGVGLAGIRDLVSFLKFNTTEKNPLAVAGKSVANRAHGFGTSQSGRLLRQLLHDGFNADQKGRQVFDGVISHVAGGGLGSFNHRFASPTRTNCQHDEHQFAADYFPFTYGDSRDPYTEQTDGILRRCRESKTVPKVFHTQSSSEYWHRSGSLVHTDPLGKEDAEIPSEVRLYTFGGCQHGAGSGVPSPRGSGQLPTSPADYRPLMRALLIALDAWVNDGKAPPPSVYPRIDDGTLVPWQQEKSGWPAIPGVSYPQVIQQPDYLYRGPQWQTEQIAAIEPPEVRGHYGVRVSAYGPDGDERGTLLLPGVRVAVATYASWNLRHESIGAAGKLLSLQGSYIPFLRTKDERIAKADPRPALLERYRDFADYQKQYLAAAEELVAARYLLTEDLPRLKALCEKFRGDFEVK